MRYAAISLATLLVPTLLAGCHENTEPNAARVVSLELSRPAGLDVMLDWPDDGVDDATGRAVFIGAYESPARELRVWGGVAERTATGEPTISDGAFDVAATRSELGIYTESFELTLWAQSGQLLPFDRAVLFELDIQDDGHDLIPTSARLLGVIHPSVAERMEVSRLDMTLSELMTAAGAEPDYDADGDGIDESWVTEGAIKAEPARLD